MEQNMKARVDTLERIVRIAMKAANMDEDKYPLSREDVDVDGDTLVIGTSGVSITAKEIELPSIVSSAPRTIGWEVCRTACGPGSRDEPPSAYPDPFAECVSDTEAAEKAIMEIVRCEIANALSYLEEEKWAEVEWPEEEDAA